MPKNPNQKQKLFRVFKMLLEQSDEAHPLSTERILELLSGFGIEAERKSIYSDIETLVSCGCDIEHQKGKNGGYYLASRDFALPELKLLVDAIQSSRFITLRKSGELIAKLERLTSVHEARALQRQVYVAGRVKTMNESIYYNIDALHTAISDGKCIRFRYFQWAVGDNLQISKKHRHDGQYYHVSPWALTWDSENYYLIGYEKRTHSIRHYRVDKMEQIGLTRGVREGREAFEALNIGTYARHVFGMFRGERQLVTLRCHEALAGVMHDRFGEDMMLRPDAEKGFFRLLAEVDVSPQLFGWLCGLGSGVAVMAPDTVRQQYLAHLRAVLSAQDAASSSTQDKLLRL